MYKNEGDGIREVDVIKCSLVCVDLRVGIQMWQKKLRAQQQLKLSAPMQQDSQQPQNSVSNQNHTNSNPQDRPPLFKLQLTPPQAQYLTKYLPHLYSFQLEPKLEKRKSSNQKDFKNDLEPPKEVKKKPTKDETLTPPLKINTSRSQRNPKVNEEIQNAAYQKYNAQRDISKRNSYEGISESLKPCIKILNLLKNSRTSWPFREPVDTVALGIPHYTQIVKEPMDLSTIQNNLRTNQYVTPTQFHADVSKIITNSYTFNSSNIEFTKFTAQFEAYYRKITTESSEGLQRGYSQTEIPTQIYNNKSQRKPKKEISRPVEVSNNANTMISMNEKKQLGLNIKKLPKEYMKGILDIVNEGKVKSVGEFDLKQLDAPVIRKLQAYVRQKLSGEAKNKQIYGYQKSKDNDKEESSFQIDQEDQS